MATYIGIPTMASEGHGQCMYRVGVEDDGSVRGIQGHQLDETLVNLCTIFFGCCELEGQFHYLSLNRVNFVGSR